MDDLKEFFEQWVHDNWNCWGLKCDADNSNGFMAQVQEQLKMDLGLFFWERGGKQFYLNSDIDWAGNKTGKFKNFLELKNDAEYEVNHGYDDERNDYYARDFLDCLACLGEERVKELIKGVN